MLPVDSNQIEYLAGQLTVCSLDQFPVVRDALSLYKDQVTEDLWYLVQNEAVKPAQQFQAAAALPTFSAEDQRWTNIVPFVTTHLKSSVSSAQYGYWLDYFEPGNQNLTDAVAAIHKERNRLPQQRVAAALGLARYWHNQPDKLLNAILVSDEVAEFIPLLDALKPYSLEVHQQLLIEAKAKMQSSNS